MHTFEKDAKKRQASRARPKNKSTKVTATGPGQAAEEEGGHRKEQQKDWPIKR